MPAPRLPVELVRDILNILVDEYEWRDEPTTKLLALATVSKTWKPLVQELALRHVEVDIGDFQLAGHDMDEARAEMREKVTAEYGGDYDPYAWQNDPLPSNENLKASQTYTNGLIALASLPRYVRSLDIKLHMRHKKDLCRTALDTFAALCHRFITTTGDASNLQESQPAPIRSLERVQVQIYQEEWVVEEQRLRRALQCLANLGPLQFFGLQFINEGQIILSDEDGKEDAAVARQTSRQIKASKVDLCYSFTDFGGPETPGDGLFWEALDPSVLKELRFGDTTRLPSLDWWTRCQILQKLHIEYERHDAVISTASDLLDAVPRLRQLRRLTLACSEIFKNMMESAAILTRRVPELRRFPSPYPLSAFLNSLSSSVVSADLHHTHFEMPADFPSVPVSNKLKLAIRTRPHARIWYAAPEGQKPPYLSARLVLLAGADGQEEWMRVVE